MNKKSIKDLDYELVKSYFLFPGQSTLPKSKQEIPDRALSAFKILDKNPLPRLEERGDMTSLEILAMQHANLLNAIGRRPVEKPDPHRNEPREFYLRVPNLNSKVEIDIDTLKDLPVTGIKEFQKIILSGL